MTRITPSWTARLLLAAASLTCAACGDSRAPAPNQQATFAVTGKVLVDERPVARAVVTFHPQGAAGPNVVRAYAKTDDTGAFKLSTYVVGDGAPAGRYAVTVQQDADDLVVIVPNQYGNPKTSGLIVEVKQEVNELQPFRLRRLK